MEALKQAENAGKRIITVVTNGDRRREQERAIVIRDRRHEFSAVLAAVLQNQQGKELDNAEA